MVKYSWRRRRVENGQLVLLARSLGHAYIICRVRPGVRDVAKQWKSGDKVKLASGGPLMTVFAQLQPEYGGEIVVCQWFDKNQNLQKGEFAPDSLVKSK
jgi:uncharacterized protein YodC (DUF2158 family)